MDASRFLALRKRMITPKPPPYRGRIAPTPTGHLHLGHARTFWIAQQRAVAAGGVLILRNEDIDRARCKPEFVQAMFDDLRWFGLDWREGPDVGGPFAPYTQSQRTELYRHAIERLRDSGFIYPCSCSRKDIQLSARAPHTEDEEPLYPGTCRPKDTSNPILNFSGRHHWRFRVPDGESISFVDGHLGPQSVVAGRDFGDFVVWRNDDVPSYQLAVVVDDAAMQITEVVRGEDLLLSTARQLLIYRALDLIAPDFYHCGLVTDDQGTRLAKRHAALSLGRLREQGTTPEQIRSQWIL